MSIVIILDNFEVESWLIYKMAISYGVAIYIAITSHAS